MATRAREMQMATVKLTKSVVDAAPGKASRYILFDSEVRGFGVRVSPSGEKSWIVEYRPGEGGRNVAKRRYTIANVSALEAGKARREAERILALVKLGGDPSNERNIARETLSVAQVAASYMVSGMATLKPSTRSLFCLYLNKHIIPKFGSKKIDALSREAVQRWHSALGLEKPVTANRLVTAISGLYRYASDTGHVGREINPARGIRPFRETARERYLSSEELARLGDAIREAEFTGIPWVPKPDQKSKHLPKPESRNVVIGEHAAAALRLLILTGCRLREILHLEWGQIDFERGLLLLSDSKTGRKTVVLNAPSLTILQGLTRLGRYVIASESAGQKDERPRADLKRPWALVLRRAGLDGLRLHDLRHTFASFGAGGGLGLPIVGKLLGHSQASTTARYAHLADDPLRRATNAIGSTISAAMGDETGKGEVVPFPMGAR